MDNNNKFVCPYANMQSCSPADDEINLLDIWNVIWSRRLLIIAVTVLVTSVAVAYALLSPKTYETTVNITPPFDLSPEPGDNALFSAISTLTGDSVFSPAITTATVFKAAINNLQARDIQAQFTDDNGVEAQLLRTIKVKRPGKNRGVQPMSVSLSGNTPDRVAKLLNEYISYVDNYTSRTVIDDLQILLHQKKLAVEKKIESARRIENEKIKQRIALLSEQKVMAEKLNIIGTPDGNFATMPLYARGSRALQVEIDSLKQRKNIDSFVAALPALQEQLRSIDKIDLKNVEIATLRTTKATTPTHPVKPKQQLVIALGLVLGLMMGVFVAFLVNFVSNLQKKEAVAADGNTAS